MPAVYYGLRHADAKPLHELHSRLAFFLDVSALNGLYTCICRFS